MPNSELQKYIENARAKGASDETIKNGLIDAGWPEDEVKNSLLPKSAELELPPPPVPHFGMWVAFQYIILFITLYISFTGLGGILDHGVDKISPDTLDRTSYNYAISGNDFWLKADIAGIIVAFPIFAILFILLQKQVMNKPAVKNLRARKVLIYITLVGTFLIMIGHLIATLFNFLGGTTTSRSFGHLIITFIVAGSIFGYLLLEVKEDRKS